jgi:ketosteroid isomerase-like protein
MQPDLAHMVERYFAAVDRKDMDGTLFFFVPDATFTVATFAAEHRGRDSEVRAMFERLFGRYERIWHGNFEHVVEAPGRIATRFDVENHTWDGQTYRKHNANFFFLRAGKFSAVHVYMSGDNALK